MPRMKPKFTGPAVAMWIVVLAACSRSAPSEPAAASLQLASDGGAPTDRSLPRKARLEAATNTRDMLAAVSPECLSCVEQNGCLDPAQQGGLCETVPGNAKSGVTEAALCINTMRCVFDSRCASPGQESYCLCGKTMLPDCYAGTSPPTGPCVPEFSADFGNDGKTMYQQFVNQKFGAGRANWIIQCAIQSCDKCRTS
jgi:hypothetical protein